MSEGFVQTWSEYVRGDQRVMAQHTEAFSCDHPMTEVRERRRVNGNTYFTHQCMECGKAVGGAVPKNEYRNMPVHAFDEALNEKWEQQRVLSLQAAKHLDTEAWKKRYAVYLLSSKWKDMRSRVLRRAHGVCEGCGAEDATDVHHLTYEHVGDEFLFELVALCRTCHERAHD